MKIPNVIILAMRRNFHYRADSLAQLNRAFTQCVRYFVGIIVFPHYTVKLLLQDNQICSSTVEAIVSYGIVACVPNGMLTRYHI